MQRRSHRVGLSFALGTALIGAALTALPALHATATEAERACTQVEAIFARGSGQDLGEGEFRKFESELDSRIGDGITFDVYELGTEAYYGFQYPAVTVKDGWDVSNAVGASFSSGYSFEYGASVWEGVRELFGYLIDRTESCDDTVFVLGGYSQGAQVIGQTYEFLPDEIREKIVFNGLFGDPKLYLPEGEGLWPPACRGQNLSEWRRTIPDCKTDGGSLGARVPYLPAGWTSSTGLWCNNDDFVCGSSINPLETSGHGRYADEGGAIEEAAREAVERLRGRLPGASPEDLDISIIDLGAGTTGLDVAFVIDSTGSMSDDIYSAKQFASTMADKVSEARGRVALIEYRDDGDTFVAATRVGLTSDIAAFQTGLDAMYASGGGDTPEALLTALMQSFNTLEWRDGATKAAVVLTDAGYHDPDVAQGWTLSDVVTRSLEIDPVNVYAVVPSYLEDTYSDLTEMTSGLVIPNSGDTAAALSDALGRITSRPVVFLEVREYYAQPGDELFFDASSSYVIDSTIEEYAWDYDGDGTFDHTGTAPTSSHVYPAEFDGFMQVRVTAADGGVGSASAPVHITTTPPRSDLPGKPQDVNATILETADGVSRVQLSWTPADALAAEWGISVNGVHIGRAPGDTTSVEITDLERSADVVLSVVGITPEWEVGSEASVTVVAEEAPEIVIPEPPTFDSDTGRYTIPGPDTTGDSYVYTVGGEEVLAGDYDLASGESVTVVAMAAQGYVFDDGAPATWTFTAPVESAEPTGTSTPSEVVTTPGGVSPSQSQPSTSAPSGLSNTGIDAIGLAALGMLALLAGIGLLAARRRLLL